MSRRPDSQPGIALARAPMPTFCGSGTPVTARVSPTPPPRPLGTVTAPTHIIVMDASGARGFGMLSRHSTRALDALDALLDYHDAANEGPDGLLPHQRPGATILDLPLPRKAARRSRRAA